VPRSSVRVSVPPRRYDNHNTLVSSLNETSIYSLEERCDTLMEDDVEIDYRFSIDGSIVEYRDKVVLGIRCNLI
jgi:hypothetical protein